MMKKEPRSSRFGILFVAVLLCLGLAAPAAFGQVIFQDRFESACADCPDAFDHFTIDVTPNPPVAGADFTMNVTAYRSGDDSKVMTSYDGKLSVTASSGALTGETDAQPITAGTAELTLQHDTVAQDVVLTVTDDIFPELTGSLTVTFVPEGDVANSRDVVISEVNWYGNGNNQSDEWIELRNISGNELNLSGWMIEDAGMSGGAVILDSGTVLANSDYLMVAQMQGADVDGERTSLTGVNRVQIQSISLGNGGEQLTLRDVEGNLIDATPTGEWPAGNQGELMSMERFDDITGGGYGDGESADSWYTWNQFAGVDTTHPESADHGTPGTENSNPFPAALYASSFEDGDPAWENAGPGGFNTEPPSGTSARTGDAVITTDSVTTTLPDREVRSVDCINLPSDSSALGVDIFAMASTDNGGNELRARLQVLFYDSADCAEAIITPGPTSETPLLQGTYEKLSAVVEPPAGATHFKIVFQIADDNATDSEEPDEGDSWAADDVAAFQ